MRSKIVNRVVYRIFSATTGTVEDHTLLFESNRWPSHAQIEQEVRRVARLGDVIRVESKRR